MTHEIWSKSWKKQLERMNQNIEGWRLDRLDLPERTALSREEYIAKQTELAASLERLLASIERILGPIEDMERAFENPSPEKPLRDLIQVIEGMLDLLGIDEWLRPKVETSAVLRTAAKPSAVPEGPVLWVEYEKDQNAYLKLLNILETLRDVPASRIPKRSGEPGRVSAGSPDVLAALRLALDGETYQIKTEDDAGVQVFELREIRGLQFRHVYVLGLVNGQIPALPEEGTLVRRRLKNPQLKAQLEQKEAEVQFLFSQVFEAAQEKLVLSRFELEGDRPTLPSPFFTAVEDQVDSLPQLALSKIVTGIGQAACELGRTFRGNSLVDLWPKISPEAANDLKPILNGLTNWQKRPSGSEVAIEWPEMLQTLFPDDYQFSPSQLETYAACPFRFFGSRVLRLEERESDPTRLHYGSLIHRILQRFYQEKREESDTPANQPLVAIRAQDRPRFIELFEEEKNKLDDGMLTPDLEALFVGSGGVLDLFLEICEGIEGGPDSFGNLFAEYPLENVRLGEDASGRPVLLTGKIDRVDGKRSDPGVAIILDYKTGGSPALSSLKVKVVDGRMLQLPLYAAALEIARPGQHVVGAAYVHLSEKAKSEEVAIKKAVVPLGQFLATKKEPDADLWNARAALDMALDFAGRIRAGRFPLTRHGIGSDEVECTAYCPLRHACRHPEGYATGKRGW